jgi:hypothetical protein
MTSSVQGPESVAEEAKVLARVPNCMGFRSTPEVGARRKTSGLMCIHHASIPPRQHPCTRRGGRARIIRGISVPPSAVRPLIIPGSRSKGPARVPPSETPVCRLALSGPRSGGVRSRRRGSAGCGQRTGSKIRGISAWRSLHSHCVRRIRRIACADPSISCREETRCVRTRTTSCQPPLTWAFTLAAARAQHGCPVGEVGRPGVREVRL